jgi:hypothetical protein
MQHHIASQNTTLLHRLAAYQHHITSQCSSSYENTYSTTSLHKTPHHFTGWQPTSTKSLHDAATEL